MIMIMIIVMIIFNQKPESQWWWKIDWREFLEQELNWNRIKVIESKANLLQR